MLNIHYEIHTSAVALSILVSYEFITHIMHQGIRKLQLQNSYNLVAAGHSSFWSRLGHSMAL